MTIKYYNDFQQGSLDWLKARKGILTSSNVCKVLTPTLKVANNDKTRSYFYQLLADKVSDFIEETYEGWDMRRGKEEEIYARLLYSEKYQPVTECAFITNSNYGFTLGCSPDGLVGSDGMIEIKSRRPGLQIKAIMEDLINDNVPKDDVLQVQAGLLVSGRKWCDYIVYSGGMKMPKVRAYPDPEIHNAIIEVGKDLEKRLSEAVNKYRGFVQDFPDTEYRPFTDDGGVYVE